MAAYVQVGRKRLFVEAVKPSDFADVGHPGGDSMVPWDWRMSMEKLGKLMEI